MKLPGSRQSGHCPQLKNEMHCNGVEKGYKPEDLLRQGISGDTRWYPGTRDKAECQATRQVYAECLRAIGSAIKVPRLFCKLRAEGLGQKEIDPGREPGMGIYCVELRKTFLVVVLQPPAIAILVEQRS